MFQIAFAVGNDGANPRALKECPCKPKPAGGGRVFIIFTDSNSIGDHFAFRQYSPVSRLKMSDVNHDPMAALWIFLKAALMLNTVRWRGSKR